MGQGDASCVPCVRAACRAVGLQIASLKRIGKGTRVVLLDRYGGSAATVARELTRKGYGKVFVIQGERGVRTALCPSLARRSRRAAKSNPPPSTAAM